MFRILINLRAQFNNIKYICKYTTNLEPVTMSNEQDSIKHVENEVSNKFYNSENVQTKCIAKLGVEIDSNGKFIDGRVNVAPVFEINEDTVLMSKRQMKRVSNLNKLMLKIIDQR